MLEKDNGRRQAHFDAKGLDSGRILDVSFIVLFHQEPEFNVLCCLSQFGAPAFVNPQYELVALRPKHLLPNGKVLVTYSRDANGLVSLKTYVAAEDHTLRESPGKLSCPRFPPFSFDYHRRNYANLNPFLVILNAEIKFRRYFRQQQPPPLPLPADPMTLIQLTTELVKLIYWDPIVKPNTPAAQIFLNTAPISAPEPQPSDAEMGYIDRGEEEEEVPTLRAPHGKIRRPAAHTTLKERMDYGQYLLSGRGKFLRLSNCTYSRAD